MARKPASASKQAVSQTDEATAAKGASDPAAPRTWKDRLRVVWREVRSIIVIVLVLSTIRSAAADWYNVPTGSMKPTIVEGDRIFVNKAAYALRFPFTDWRMIETGDPQRGEIVILYSPKDDERLVKRVVGVPGDVVELRNNRLIINGAPLQYTPADAAWMGDLDPADRAGRVISDEQLGAHSHPVIDTPQRLARRDFVSPTVPAGQYLLMGDNRDESNDSRFFGFVPREKIAGRAIAVLWSLDANRWYAPRFSRFFKSLP